MTTIEQLAALFHETAKAHHAAFADVDGVDPNWPQWYAHYIKPKFDEFLDVSLEISEIVALLLGLAQEHAARGQDKAWPFFYARIVRERFIAAPVEGLALYEVASCPYCALVRRTIDELGVLVERRNIVTSPHWRDQLIEARGRATVPVLRCESPEGAVRWIPESRDIIRFLRDRSGARSRVPLEVRQKKPA